ncbi:MAG TPA: OsmC family protein [Arenicellales bacterium]|nr:OsmC family protein [Arenicellales bacterium]
MQEFPHHYKVRASGGPDADVSVSSEGLETIPTSPPPEFGGPGGRWSPETLLAAAVADCLILSFRAVARASKLSWVKLACEVDARLDREDRVTRFTEFALRAVLEVPSDTDEERARRVLEKAKETCLITNSLSAETHLQAEVKTV